MNKLLQLLLVLFMSPVMFSQVGIATTNPSNASMLEINSTADGGLTYKGFMPPRVRNNADRDAINPSILDVGLLVFVRATGILNIWNGISWEDLGNPIAIVSPPWVNEFHYENDGVDVNEGFEIAGQAGIDLSDYRLDFINGVTGTIYATQTLAGIIPNESNNYGAIAFFQFGIQNGNPADGFALIQISSNTSIQFLSYEGIMTSIQGITNGMTSEDMGVQEENSPTTPIGVSLQLTGTGSQYSDFSWVANIAQSMYNAITIVPEGSINSGQIIN